jgi:hypothetical protein
MRWNQDISPSERKNRAELMVDAPGSGTERQLDHIPSHLVICRVDELRPHPSYLKHQISVLAPKLSALAERGDLALLEPLAITQDRTIIDGYVRWELAQQQRRPTLPCITYEPSQAEALQCLIQRHRRSKGLNDFMRILLALELEPSFQEKARSNQRAGGQHKGLSKLTEAERLDVRCNIAAVAGVSAGNVSKVKQLMTAAHSDLVAALRGGEISIHRAWKWCKLSPNQQRKALWQCRSERGIGKKIQALVSRHRLRSSPTVLDFADLVRHLSSLDSNKFGPVSVAVTDAPGKALLVTKELLRALGLQQITICATNNR